VSGAKGAGLARARAAGFPVLDGFVIAAEASASVLAHAARLLDQSGTGGARMSIIRADLPHELLVEIERAASELPEPLIVRSSSVLEGQGEWSGAFTSVPEVRRDEIPKAAKSVWATCFALAVLERFEAAGLQPGTAPMGVLVQPEILPEFGGVAMVDVNGSVTVTAVKGSPKDLLAGWAPGARAVFEDGKLSGRDAIELMGGSVLRSVVDLARRAHDELDHNLIEWAVLDGHPLLLQIQKSVRHQVTAGIVIPAALAHPFARDLVELAHAHPGALGEDLVLGWLPGLRAPVRPVPVAPGSPVEQVYAEARVLAATLTADAWGLPPAEAAAQAALVLRRLRSDRPDESIEVLRDLRSCDPEAAAVLLGMAAYLQAAIGGPERRGLDRWEPVLAGVIALQGEVHIGVPGVPGIGAGRLVWVDSSKSTQHVRPRDIIVMQYPLANFSPLLWDAAGVITLGGAPTAHLFEVARSLTVPAVLECPIAEIVRAGPRLGMLDGDAGRVAILSDRLQS
jgi:phosphohistidine swiveling domain-containing protein